MDYGDSLPNARLKHLVLGFRNRLRVVEQRDPVGEAGGEVSS